MRKGILVLLLACASLSHAQDTLLVTDGFTYNPDFTGRKIVATGAVGGLLGLSLYWCYDSWWRNTGGGFHFVTENWLNGYARGIDKIGHFYTSYFYFHMFRNIMLWGGYEGSTADWWALGSATFFALAVEIGDGLTPQYGFDYQDLTFNLCASPTATCKRNIPFLKNFNFNGVKGAKRRLQIPPSALLNTTTTIPTG
ncbi:MAG: DUF2279 domain-containing protein [Bacteroidetes bacterium]|nr:DUF2279 domain-containing protein [Bacteroidota bacterium]